LRDAGFTVEPPVKNQGKGAAMMRIDALRRLGPQLWFNEATTEPGRDAIGFYHERKDDIRNAGLGPEHDWSSHAADALGLMAICYEAPGRAGAFNRAIRYADRGWV
jgi:phage terminase large subunit